MDSDKKRVLVIGAGGFIGGFMVEEGLRRGMDVTAGVRASTSRRYLTDPRIRFLTLDYDNIDALTDAFASVEAFDWVIYNLGATRALHFPDFNRINYLYLRNVLDALRAADRMPSRLLFMSSLSAVGKGDERGYTPLAEDIIPRPDTRYGLSKIKAETLLQSRPEVPWIIFRPTGVYGPREQDYLMMVRCIDHGLDPGIGMRRQMLTFIYVDDLVRACYDALERAPLRRIYHIAEPRAYSQSEFRSITARALGRRIVVPLRLPLWAARAVCAMSGAIGRFRMKTTTLNSDKYRILSQRNWACSTERAVRDWGFEPQVDLAEGMRRVVEAYRQDKQRGRKERRDGR